MLCMHLNKMLVFLLILLITGSGVRFSLQGQRIFCPGSCTIFDFRAWACTHPGLREALHSTV